MKRPFKYAILLILPLVYLAGCRQGGTASEEVQADYIKYRVHYMDNMAGDIPTSLLPDEMDSYYTSRYIMTRINGFLGQFSLIQIANLKQNSVTTMLNFFGTKIYYEGEKGEIPAGILSLKDPEITMTGDTATIGGLTSYRTRIACSDTEYDIYYTKDISIKSPNITTPYAFIEYVLSDFRVQLSVLKMRLTMTYHKDTTVESSIFEIPDDYKQVTRDTMVSIINSLFTKE